MTAPLQPPWQISALPGGAVTQSPWGDQKQIGQAAEVQGSQGPSKATQKPHPLS